MAANGSAHRSTRAGMIFQKVGPHLSRVACQSGTAARSPVRLSSNARSFPKQRLLTMTTFGRSSWRYSRPTQICNRTAELIQSQEKNVELADEALRLAKARLDAGAGVQLDVLNATVQLLTRNRRVYKRCSDTTRRWLNSIGQPGHRAPTRRCSRTSSRAPRQPKPTTPAAT